MNIKKSIAELLYKPEPQVRGFLFECDNVRLAKGEELNNIKVTCANYIGDGVLARLISSKANQIKDRAIEDCLSVITGGYSDREIKQAGLIMFGAVHKIKALGDMVSEISFFANDPNKQPLSTNPNSTL